MTDTPKASTPWGLVLITLVALAMGPGAALGGVVHLVQLAQASERTEATVTRVRRDVAQSKVNWCPTLAWSHAGAEYDREVMPCSADEHEFTVGDTLPIRLDPAEPSRVFIDTFVGTHGTTLVLFGLSLVGTLGLVHALRKWHARRAEPDVASR